MKRLSFIIALVMGLCSCSSGIQEKKKQQVEEPWNVSIYLDLSDRLTKGNGEPQILRDTAIIGRIIQLYMDNVVKHKIVPCNDKFQVFFYPTDGVQSASTLSMALKVDLEQYNQTPARKKEVLYTMQQDIMQNVMPIYENTLQNRKWLGSDIWGFFKNNKIKISCVREGYRNILVVLTDGYIFHVNSKFSNGNEYSYLLQSNIGTPGAKLIKCNDGLEDLEVLFLEINPTQFSHIEKMQKIIGTWLEEMGVQHYEVIETDVVANVIPAIDKFFK